MYLLDRRLTFSIFEIWKIYKIDNANNIKCEVVNLKKYIFNKIYIWMLTTVQVNTNT